MSIVELCVKDERSIIKSNLFSKGISDVKSQAIKLFFNLGYFFCIFFIFAIIIYNLLLTITFFLNNQKSFTNSLHLIKK